MYRKENLEYSHGRQERRIRHQESPLIRLSILSESITGRATLLFILVLAGATAIHNERQIPEYLARNQIITSYGNEPQSLIDSESGRESDSPPADLGIAEAASVVKSYIEEAGDNPVNFELARRLTLPVVNLFIQSTKSEESLTSTNSQVFIARGDFKVPEVDTNNPNLRISPAQLLEVPGIQQLSKDYPASPLSENNLRKLINRFGNNEAAGLAVGDRSVFLNLPAINSNVNYLSQPLPEYLGNLMYSGIGMTTLCQPESPITKYVTALLHELTHRQSIPKSARVEPELAKALIKKWPKVEQNLAFRSGFTVYLNSGEKIIDLEEIVADYVAAKISIANDLKFILSADSSLNDLYNFEVLLRSSQISDTELVSLHREGRYQDFLVRIGIAADRYRNSNDNPLDTGLELARLITDNFLPFLPMPAWDELKGYFPQINNTRTLFWPPGYLTAPSDTIGCIYK